MESKYKERAEELFDSYETALSDKTREFCVGIMCQLAEEVHQEHVKLFEEMFRSFDNHLPKSVVEELLQQQRELCSEKAEVDDSDLLWKVVNKDSILNAKFKID